MTPLKTVGLALAAILVTASLASTDAQAKRLGGGKSVGKQAPSATMQRDAAPASPAATPSGATSASPAAPAAAAAPAARPAAPAAASGGNRWLGPIAGLAAGLGLAALASHLGFGDALASFMLVALLAVAAVVVVRMILSRRSASPLEPAYAGAQRSGGLVQGGAVSGRPPIAGAPAGRDLPTEVAGATSIPGSASVPAGFDADGFVRNAKVYFVRLQAAFDAGDTDDLREFTSTEMLAELERELAERQGRSNRTDVVRLDAHLLGVDTDAAEQVASVRFSGLLREDVGASAEPFDEVWNFARPADGRGGWVLAGIQQVARA